MEFEEILNDVGGYGKYQKLLISLFVIPLFTVLPCFSMPIIFLTSIPDHWCYVPVLAKSNLSQQLQKKLIRPLENPTCLMYDLNYTNILITRNWTIDYETDTKPCDKGWQFDKTNYDETATTRWNLVCKDDHFVPLMLTCAFIGVLVGMPLFTLLSERFGRKTAFFWAAALIALTDVGSALCPVFSLVIVLRIAEGMGIAAVTTEAYIIVLELVSPRFHTRINGISSVAWYAGACLVPFLAWFTRHWVRFTAVNSTCAAYLLIYSKFLPESPSWLLSYGKYEEVAKILHTIGTINGGPHRDLTERVQLFGEEYRRQLDRVPKPSFRELFKHKLLSLRFLLIVTCWMCNSLIFFGLQMNTRNLVGNQFINFFLASAVEIPAHFATFLLLNVGRRMCLMSAMSLTATACLVTFPFQDFKPLFIVSTMLAKAGTASAYMTLYVMGPEFFPLSLKVTAITACCVMGSAASCFSSYSVLLAKYGQVFTFVVYFTSMVVAIPCACLLPETVKKTLPKTISEAENFEKKFGNCFSPCFCSRTLDSESSVSTTVAPPPVSSSASPEERQRFFRYHSLPFIILKDKNLIS